MNLELKPHNQKTYEEVKEIFKTSNKCAISNACGTGKSYVIYRILQDYKDKNVILLTPRIVIKNQFQNNPYLDFKNVQNITYSFLTSKYRKNEIKNIFSNIDLIITDELHRTGALKWGEAINCLLKLFPNAKLLGASATGTRYVENRNMVEELFDGNSAGNIDLITAINEGILPKPIYVSSYYDIRDVTNSTLKAVEKSKLKDKSELIKDISELNFKWENTYNIANIIDKFLSKLFKEQNGLKVIIFCKNIKELHNVKKEIVMQFYDIFPDAKVESTILYYRYKDSHDNLEKFRKAKKDNSIHLAFAIQMLDEGVHIPDVDSIIMVRKLMSLNVYIQQLGRILEVGKDKTPVILDLINNCDSDFAKTFCDQVYKRTEMHTDIKIKSKKYDAIEVGFYDFTEEIINVVEKINDIISNRWSKEEDDLIKKYYKSNGIKFLINKLSNRTENTIISRAFYLGLSDSKPRWTNEEDKLVIETYNGRNMCDLIKLLPNKSEAAIRGRLKTLKLTKPSKWVNTYDDIMKKYYEKEGTKILERLPGVSKDLVIRRAKKLGLRMLDKWTEEEINILKNKCSTNTLTTIQEFLPNKIKSQILTKKTRLGLKFRGKR